MFRGQQFTHLLFNCKIVRTKKGDYNMKRLIKSSSNLSKRFRPNYLVDVDDNFTTSVSDAIDAQTFSIWDNYRHLIGPFTFDEILEVIKQYLEEDGMGLYPLKCGVDFEDIDIAREMLKYDWTGTNSLIVEDEWPTVQEWFEDKFN